MSAPIRLDTARVRRQPAQGPDLSDRPWLDPDAKPEIEIAGVAKRYGAVAAVDGVDLKIYKGEIFALVGGSGCGKTTLLRMLAGFASPSAGRILIDGQDMAEVPPHRRPVNMMFQSYALFPHMSVEKNVGYGLRRLGLPKSEAEARIAEALEMVQMAPFAKRRPHQLSGGQRQRVALARALIRRPKVLLLDEPLSALDKKLREQTQFELMGIQHRVGTTFIVVTHDQEEAMALASRIAVMDRGRVLQVGTPAEIYEYPQSRFVADFVGTTNLFEGTVAGIDGDTVAVRCAETGALISVAHGGQIAAGQKVWVAIRPEKIRVTKEPPDGAANRLAGTVWELGYLGRHSTFRVRTEDGKLVTSVAQNARRTAERAIDWNDAVHLSWPADAAILLLA